MRVIIAGGLGFVVKEEHRIWLNILHDKYKFTWVVTGGATGADTFGDDWARLKGIDRVIYPANWVGKGKQARSFCNAHMVRNVDAVVLLSNHRDTHNLRKIAKSHKLLILEYK